MGSHIAFLLKPESVYGTLPTGNWERVPILDFDPGTASDIVEDPVIGFGHRESVDVFRGPISYKPKVTVPMDLNNSGYWLKYLFGNYAVTGAGPYTHVFTAGATSILPSLALEAGYPDANGGAGVYFDYTGVSVDTAALDLSPTGATKMVLSLIAQKETKNTATQGGTPASQVYTPFSQLQGSFLIGAAGSTTPAAAVGNIIGATLNVTNALDAQPGVSSGGLILGADAGLLKITGDVTVRFDSTAVYDDAIAATNISLLFGYDIDVSNSLHIVMPRVAIGRHSPVIKGPAGVDVKIPFHAQRDTGSSASVIATLINSVATY
ncbi:MAG TPA: hypothetical protein DEQ40_16405 [Oxalobacteraceae bacterium]|jgi:hypothetical protein|nr:hypothetical protein [Oxalobacteraceae bacterium]